MLARIVAFPDEVILGRDVLNQAVVMLDGPGLSIWVRVELTNGAQALEVIESLSTYSTGGLSTR